MEVYIKIKSIYSGGTFVPEILYVDIFTKRYLKKKEYLYFDSKKGLFKSRRLELLP